MNTLLQRIPLFSVLFWGIATQAAQLPIILEAEDAKLFGELKVEQVSGFSGNKYVHDFHINSDSYYLYENIEVDQAGTYELKAFTTGTARPFYIKVNDYERIWHSYLFAEIAMQIFRDSEYYRTKRVYLYRQGKARAFAVLPDAAVQGYWR